MQKPLTYYRQGFATRKLNSILTQTLPKNQESRISELSNYIRDHRLTESVENLSKAGYEYDLAIFFIANLQNLEVAA